MCTGQLLDIVDDICLVKHGVYLLGLWLIDLTQNNLSTFFIFHKADPVLSLKNEMMRKLFSEILTELRMLPAGTVVMNGLNMYQVLPMSMEVEINHFYLHAMSIK